MDLAKVVATLRYLAAKWGAIGSVITALPLLFTGNFAAGIAALVAALAMFSNSTPVVTQVRHAEEAKEAKAEAAFADSEYDQ